MALVDTFTSLKNKINTLRGNNSVVNFAYTLEAYETDDADGRTVFNPDAENNIPVKTNTVIKLNPFVTNKGLRDQASSFPRMFINHFFGRTSYNLNKTVDVLYGLLDTLITFISNSNGLATLDSNGRVPSAQLTEDAIEYQGAWNASTNTPNLNTIPKTKGDMYLVSAKGTQDIGEGSIQFNVGDEVIYNGTIWQRIPTGDVDSVDNVSPDANGNVTLQGNNVGYNSGVTNVDTVTEAIAYIKAKLGYI
jgi:hypothetical protein